MNQKYVLLLFFIGVLMVVDDFIIHTDWTQFGIPSIFIGSFHLHHWIIGMGLILFVSTKYRLFQRKLR